MKRGILFFALLAACGQPNHTSANLAGAPAPKWPGRPGANVQWQTLKPFNGSSAPGWGNVLRDIMDHEAPGDSNSYDDPITQGHETSHGIHNYIRNNMGGQQGARVNGFYALENRAVVIAEPNMYKHDVAPYIPQSLHWNRYDLYIAGQSEWDDSPLYIFDEWNAYVNGGAVGVDQVQRGLWNREWQDGVSGTVEFVVYAAAVAMAAQEHDPKYLASNSQFREFLAFNIERAMKVYKQGAVMDAFKWDEQDRFLQNFQAGKDAEDMRQFCRTFFGADWTKQVLGF